MKAASDFTAVPHPTMTAQQRETLRQSEELAAKGDHAGAFLVLYQALSRDGRLYAIDLMEADARKEGHRELLKRLKRLRKAEVAHA